MTRVPHALHSDLGLFEGVMLPRNKCPTVNSACAAVISACNFLQKPTLDKASSCLVSDLGLFEGVVLARNKCL